MSAEVTQAVRDVNPAILLQFSTMEQVVRDSLISERVGLSAAAGRTATTLLYGLQPWDAVSLAVGMAGLATVALLASWLPARRASRLAPTIALREE